MPFGQLLSGGVPDSIGYVVSQEEGETVARRSVVPLRDPAPATDEAWWTPEGSASSIGAPVETAALVAHARPAPSSGGRGIGRFAARNVVVSGALGGAAAGLVGSVAQGAVAASLGQEMQVVVFVGLVCGLLGLVMNGWQPVVVRGVRGGIGPAVIGLMMGAAAGVVGLGYADFIADSMFEVDQVRAPQVLALVWMLVAAFVGMTIGILSSFRAAFAGLFGGAIGGAIGGALHGSTTAQLVRGGLILDGVDPATVAVTMAVGCIIGISVGSVTRALRRASLTVIEGRLQGVEVLIKKSSATIGCSSKSTLVIASTADATVMPKHATIRLVDGGIGEIELHASASIDGVSVEGISPLVSGAVIRIGESFIRYERRV